MDRALDIQFLVASVFRGWVENMLVDITNLVVGHTILWFTSSFLLVGRAFDGGHYKYCSWAGVFWFTHRFLWLDRKFCDWTKSLGRKFLVHL